MFDFTAIAGRLRTVSWSNYNHPPRVVSLSGVARCQKKKGGGTFFQKSENQKKKSGVKALDRVFGIGGAYILMHFLLNY